MVQNRWKYFRGENSLPMYSFGHGDGINLYTVSALPRLIAAFHDNFGKPDSEGHHPYVAIDVFLRQPRASIREYELCLESNPSHT